MAPTGRVANADAAVLASIGKTFGLDIAVDRVNLSLTILAVAVLELGAGLCFAIGEGAVVASGTTKLAGKRSLVPAGNQSRSAAATNSSVLASEVVVSGLVDTGRPALPAPDKVADTQPNPAQPADAAEPVNTGGGQSAGHPDAAADAHEVIGGHEVVRLLQDRGGVLVASQRAVGELLGWSKSRTGETLHAMAAAGLVKLTTTARGTVIQLAA